MINAPQLRPSALGPSAAVLAAMWSIGLLVTLPLESAVLVLPAGLLPLAIAFEPRLPAVREGLGLSAPLWLFGALHHRAVGSWWLGDDPCHLVQTLNYGLWRPYVEPVGYFLTPSLLLSLGLDLRWFGFDPAGFYLHHLAAFAVLVVAAYLFSRVYLPAQAAAFAVALFVASSPAWAVAQQLMNRHYLEGLIAALVSLWLYRRSLVTGRSWMAVLGALLYLVATSAKEVFVPLVLLLPLLATEAPRRRWRHAIPYALAAVIYAGWRLFVRGVANSVTAYGALSGEADGLAILTRVPEILGWSQGPLPAVAVLLGACVALVIFRVGRRATLGALVIGVALAAPLLPVSGRLEPRHLFLPALAAASAVLFALWRATDRVSPNTRLWLRGALSLLLLLATLAATARSPVASQLATSARSYQGEGQTLLAGNLDGLLMTEIEHSHHLQCLSQLKKDLLGRADGPGFCGDPCYCASAYPLQPLWLASPQGGVSSVEPPGSCSVDAPLEVEMSHDLDRRLLTWRFGPYEEGDYSALLISGSEHPGISVAVAVPRQGTLWTSDSLRFVVRYRSPAGWSTYSAVHQIDPGGQVAVVQ